MGIELNSKDIERLGSTLTRTGVESIAGVLEFTTELRTLVARRPETEEIVTLDDKYAATVRSLIGLGLGYEFQYIEGLCTSGSPEAGLQRLDSEYGPHGFIELFRKVMKGSSEPSAERFVANWS